MPLAKTVNEHQQRLRIEIYYDYVRKIESKSSEILSSELTLSNGKHLSTRTVRRRLPTIGHKSYRAKKKPLRTPTHKKQKLLFAREHQC